MPPPFPSSTSGPSIKGVRVFPIALKLPDLAINCFNAAAWCVCHLNRLEILPRQALHSQPRQQEYSLHFILLDRKTLAFSPSLDDFIPLSFEGVSPRLRCSLVNDDGRCGREAFVEVFLRERARMERGNDRFFRKGMKWAPRRTGLIVLVP
ncbi:hypothetical protein MRB53_035019 [Persea americana]|uniref:Uncharacterized protein n=1 Tax=Persea americana TaxID=3435 RepID=A0ACC2K3Z2_PERAE|nr:hypothetical protein MRB53_035019 [Persea americana]